MSRVWFTADLHLGHKNIARGESSWAEPDRNCRPFDTIADHDDYLLAQLNKHVKPADVLYHLGDLGLGFHLQDRLKEARERIRCQNIYLSIGNHDKLLMHERTRELYRPLFLDIRDIYYKRIAKRKFVLYHCALRTWFWQRRGGIHLYGHSHGNLPDWHDQLCLDVGVDTCLYGHTKFTPYSIEEVLAIMDIKAANKPSDQPRDHHGGY